MKPVMEHTHPIQILEYISGYFWLLLLPLVRGLLTFRGGLWAWLSGVWFDLLVLAAIFGFAFLRWYAVYYSCTTEGILIEKGIFSRIRFVVPYTQTATLSLESPWYYRPIRAVRLRLDSNAGNRWKFDFSLLLSRSAAEAVMKRTRKELFRAHAARFDMTALALNGKTSDRSSANAGRRIRRKKWRSRGLYVALLSFVSSRTVAGVVFTAAAVVQTGKILGREIEDYFLKTLTDTAKAFAFGVPPFAVFIAILILLGWLISFLLNLFRNMRFSVSRERNSVEIACGLFSLRHCLLQVSKINCLELQQSLFTRMFRIYSLFAHCAGYGKGKNELAVLFPALRKPMFVKFLGDILPEWNPPQENQVCPKRRSISRFLLPPLLSMACSAVVFIVASVLLPNFAELFCFLGAMLELSLLWWFLARMAAFFHTGVAFLNGQFTLRAGKRFGFFTVMVRKNRVVRWELRQSIWQKFSKTCNLVVYVFSEGRKRYVIPSLPLEETVELLKQFEEQL